jgi:glyceraldehyde 3-phosphate dehydrogenase
MKVAINGFGRIGRLVFRHLMEASGGNLEVAAVNDVADLDNLAYLLRHDSAQGDPKADISVDGDTLRWNDRQVKYLSVRDPSELPWADMGVDYAIEASGMFTNVDDASKHLDAGAKRVIITAPAKGDAPTICMGVNEETYDPDEHKIISNASCTTNCLAPVAKVLDEQFGIVQGALTTIHAYTSSQKLVDAPSKKWRRGRAAAVSIVPTTTGAAKATTKVLPHLAGKMDGMAMRVPTAVGSIIDFVATTEREVSVDAVNDAMRAAADSDRLRHILGVTDEELVSADIVGTNWSALVDAQSTMTFGDNMVKVVAWYDNEWAYAKRVVDITIYVAEQS